jgi:hypothetical protein
VISTPVTVVSGLAAGARRGILIKGGVYLEEARKLKAVALDKTGTITEGKPKLVAFEPVDAGLGSKSWRGWPEPAARSDHPVSKAIADGVSPPRKRWTNFRPLPGAACRGDRRPAYVLANHRWIEERGQCSPELEAAWQCMNKRAAPSLLASANGSGHLRGGRHHQTLVGAGRGRPEGAGRDAGDADRRQPRRRRPSAPRRASPRRAATCCPKTSCAPSASFSSAWASRR